MAIELSPKTTGENKSPILNILLTFGIVALILAVGGYFYLGYASGNLKKSIKEKEDTILQKRASEINDLEALVSSWDRKIKDYNIIFGSHGLANNFFTFLEKATHPRVYWSDFSFTASATKGDEKIILKGLTDTFASLQQQIIVINKQGFVKSINLTQASLGKNGRVEFELEVVFHPGFLNPPKSDNTANINQQ